MAILDPAVRECFVQICMLRKHAVEISQIATVVGLQIERVEAILKSDEYLQIEKSQVAEKVVGLETTNELWDGLESVAVKHLKTAMDLNPSDELALQVAALANKAKRRGTADIAPIQSRENMTTVILLQPQFVKELQNSYALPDKLELPQKPSILKETNFLPIDKVKGLLGAGTNPKLINHANPSTV